MKKLNIRSLVFGLLLMASISSYSYLTIVSAQNNEDSNSFYVPVQESELEAEEKEIYLPDVEIVNRAIEVVTRLGISKS